MKFQLGMLVATQNVICEIDPEDITNGLRRHVKCDWGDVDKEDWKANDVALIQGTRLLSSYKSAKGVKYWIITEWDRSLTTVLLPSDY